MSVCAYARKNHSLHSKGAEPKTTTDLSYAIVSNRAYLRRQILFISDLGFSHVTQLVASRGVAEIAARPSQGFVTWNLYVFTLAGRTGPPARG